MDDEIIVVPSSEERFMQINGVKENTSITAIIKVEDLISIKKEESETGGCRYYINFWDVLTSDNKRKYITTMEIRNTEYLLLLEIFTNSYQSEEILE